MNGYLFAVPLEEKMKNYPGVAVVAKALVLLLFVCRHWPLVRGFYGRGCRIDYRKLLSPQEIGKRPGGWLPETRVLSAWLNLLVSSYKSLT